MTVPGRFGAVLTAMVTPFDDEGALDLEGAATLARWLVENGNDGLIVAGTTGESPALSDAEKADLWRAVCEAVTVPVIAGSGTNDTGHSIELTRVAEECGAAGILAVAPYYNRPSQAGFQGHFRAIAEATSLPVMLYDIPIRAGRKIAHETLLDLAAGVPNIVALKDAAANPAASAKLMAEAPGGFELYSGDDDFTLPLLSIGASGTVGVDTHWTAVLQGQMLSAYAKGDVEEARQINARLVPSHDFKSTEDAPNPLPTKAMLRVLGLPAGQARLPMGPAPAGLEDRARDVLAALGTDAPAGIA